MRLILCDLNPSMRTEWCKTFGGVEAVEIYHGSIFDRGADAIVSPANSFGFMDGGIDQLFLNHYGNEVQDILQRRIRGRPYPELLVGEAELVALPAGKHVQWMISAPTMRTPRWIVDPDAVRLSTRAAFLLAKKVQFKSILMTGMGAGSGAVPANVVAEQMRKGFDDVFRQRPFPTSWKEAANR